MGRAKEMMMEHEANVACAASYLVKVGMLEHCEYHDETYGGGVRDLESDFWRNAVADKKRGARGPVPWAEGMEVREYTDALKAAYEEYCGDECGWCAKHRDE